MSLVDMTWMLSTQSSFCGNLSVHLAANNHETAGENAINLIHIYWVCLVIVYFRSGVLKFKSLSSLQGRLGSVGSGSTWSVSEVTLRSQACHHLFIGRVIIYFSHHFKSLLKILNSSQPFGFPVLLFHLKDLEPNLKNTTKRVAGSSGRAKLHSNVIIYEWMVTLNVLVSVGRHLYL